MQEQQRKQHHHSLRNIIYRDRNGVFNIEKLKLELQKEKPFSDEDELGATLTPTLSTLLWATLMITGALLLLLWFCTSISLKLFPTIVTLKAHWLSFVANDWYYFIIVPISLPTFMILVYLNWFFMQVFKHNGETTTS